MINLCFALFLGLGDFTMILLSLSLSLSIPFTSFSFSLSLSHSLSFSYLSLPRYISPSTFLSLSLFSLSFSLAYLMDVFVLVKVYVMTKNILYLFTPICCTACTKFSTLTVSDFPLHIVIVVSKGAWKYLIKCISLWGYLNRFVNYLFTRYHHDPKFSCQIFKSKILKLSQIFFLVYSKTKVYYLLSSLE